MLDNNIKKPMLIGIGLYIFSYLITIVVTVTQYHGGGIFNSGEYGKDVTVIPMQIYTGLINILKLVVFYLIMATYKGNSRRVVEVVLLIVHVILGGIIGLVTGYLGSILNARKGTEYIVAYQGMNNAINIFTVLFTTIAGLLIVIAIGRYGISKRNQIPFQGGMSQTDFGGPVGGFNNEYMA